MGGVGRVVRGVKLRKLLHACTTCCVCATLLVVTFSLFHVKRHLSSCPLLPLPCGPAKPLGERNAHKPLRLL